MSTASRTRRPASRKPDGFLRSLITGSRVLMGLISVLLVVSPWTEHFGTFDNFPHGQDFELSLLAFLALLCLVLLLAVRRKQGLKDLVADRSSVPLIAWKLGRPDRGCARVANACHSPPLPSLSPGAYNFPLLI